MLLFEIQLFFVPLPGNDLDFHCHISWSVLELFVLLILVELFKFSFHNKLVNQSQNTCIYHKEVKDKVKKDLPNKRLYTVINSLRTGYTKLNAYQFHLNQHLKNDKCEHCNQWEDVEHYLLNCRKYEIERERLIQKHYFIRENNKLDLDTLLEANSPDLENILPALADFIEETDRF